MALSLNGVSVTSADGSSRDLATDNGSVLLIVNVASQCGFTKQYAGLQQLHERYGKQGLKVIGFPCNDFGAQEPGTIEEIKTFCSSNYGVSFELMSKVASDAAPFDTLTQA
ncbi:MAG TPA: glutathione peroxidase, partial [Synechococcales bacterium UBA8647]|nr:glutathione peroxidase [Synechococcales bacterium UBA8647]